MVHLIIDAEEEYVRVTTKSREKVYQNRWFSFYALLFRDAICRPGQFVSVDRLRQMPEWLLVKPQSVGVMVSRHLLKLKDVGFSELVISKGKTISWRLGVPEDQVELVPSRDGLLSWVSGRTLESSTTPDEQLGEIAPWLTLICDALISLETGDLADALAVSSEAKLEAGGRSILYDISSVIERRVQSRLNQPLDPVPRVRTGGRLGSALRYRLELLSYQSSDISELASVSRNLARLHSQLQRGPDINGLCRLYNIIGLTVRRQEDFSRARGLLALAMAYAVLSADYSTLQAAMFNYGHCLALERPKSRMAAKEAIKIIEKDRALCLGLGVGQDTAQAEIVLGLLSQELGLKQEAKRWAGQARLLDCVQHSPYDQAGVTYLEARLEAEARLAEGRVGGWSVVQRFELARDFYGAAGQVVAWLDKELETIKLGRLPSWERNKE